MTIYDYLIAVIIDKATLSESPYKYIRVVASRKRNSPETIIVYGSNSIDGPWEIVKLPEMAVV